MTNEQKKQVKDALVRYTEKFESQAKAAESLEGISPSTISQVKNNNWQLLSERLWHDIARQVGFYCPEWQAADTSVSLLLRILFSDAQHYSMSYGISIAEGLGKTFTAGKYAKENPNVYYLACSEEYNRKSFLTRLMNAVGAEGKGAVPEMMQQLTTYIAGKDEPVFIFDDAHKLKDRVLHLIVLLANSFSGNAGIVIMGQDSLRMRIIEGVRLKKIGFDEIYKNIGRRFITLGNLGPKDVELVCQANGIYHEDLIFHIKDTCANLHEVCREITEHLEMRMAA